MELTKANTMIQQVDINHADDRRQPWSLSDCHEAEHLLIGTHSRDLTKEPVCITCQLSQVARAG